MHVSDFDDFVREIHGWSPLPWQRDLVQEILERRTWPALVDVPTGLGKTTLLDIAVFINALEADLSSTQRIGRRRIFFVVDRRIVVDQAARHAKKLAQGLASASPGSISAEAARRLGLIRGDTAPDELVPVVRMRGGVSWDAAWLARPDQLGIVTGTVDQVGSRLLFRGYGVSSRRRPIDAALVGTDSLILVDEAHLATALTTTLDQIRGFESPTAELGLPSPAVVHLTATARPQPEGWVTHFDEAANLANPVAKKRLTAPKTLQLETCTKAAAVKTISKQAIDRAARPGARVLVVCNTIDRARSVHAEIANALPEVAKPLLLIGRSRQPDREAIVERALELFGADLGTHQRIAEDSNHPAVLVATQTVEVGVDLDATDLVTDVAAWDSLVQRFGRVNRRGNWSSATVTVIQDDDKKPPVYGSASTSTADFLRSLLSHTDSLDVSPLALRKLVPPAETRLPDPAAPLLTSVHLDAWTRTEPAPTNDAPLDPYLHGLDNGVAPVAIAWRDGLLDSLGENINGTQATQAVDAVPVRAEECVEVPLAATRRWLVGEKPIPVSDWDDDDDWDVPFGVQSERLVLRRDNRPDGSSIWNWIEAASLRPGDTIVAPTELGGLDQFGWAPSSKERVKDVAELVALDRGQAILRLDRSLPSRLHLEAPDESLWDRLKEWQAADEPEDRAALQGSCEQLVQQWLETAQSVGANPWERSSGDGSKTRRQLLIREMSRAVLQEAPHHAGPGQPTEQFLHPVAVLRPDGSKVPWREASDDTPDGTVHLNQRDPVSLRQHGEAVGYRAQEIAIALGIPTEIARVVTDAARWHDLGKVDPRFQAMLFEGDPVRAAIASEPLAKSGMPPGDLQRHRDAYRRSNMPRRGRHEAWSQALVAQHVANLAEPYPGDSELLLHLVSSHHGYARPLLPAVVDTATHTLEANVDGTRVTAELPRLVDVNQAERFQALNLRYGRWGLALLESIVRCADMTISGEGS